MTRAVRNRSHVDFRLAALFGAALGASLLAPARAVAETAPPLAAAAHHAVSWTTTRPDEAPDWINARTTHLFAAGQAPGIPITVDPSKRFQPIEGFGASMTEASVIVLNRMAPATRRQLMKLLFSRREGAAFSLIRVPIGASDFVDPVAGTYTYDDTTDDSPDPDLSRFDMYRDAKTLATLKEALRLQPGLRVVLSPWTPPRWMKTPHTHNGGKLDDQYRGVYARYLVRVVQAYETAGIPVHAITVQNEPWVSGDWAPSNPMSEEDEQIFVGQYLGPEMARAGLSRVRIVIFDHNWGGGAEYAEKVLQDRTAAKYVGGVAFHCYGGSIDDVEAFTQKYPDLATYQTECTASLTSYDYIPDMHWWTWTQVVRGAEVGTRSGMGWNLVLDDKGGPGLESSCSGCRGLITANPKSGQYLLNSEYYALAHGSRYLQPGAVRIDSRTESKSGHVAYLNPDGTVVLVLVNFSGSSETVSIRDPGGESFSFDQPAGALTTFHWRPAPPRGDSFWSRVTRPFFRGLRP